MLKQKCSAIEERQFEAEKTTFYAEDIQKLNLFVVSSLS
jgi:hypothetical protein